MKKHIKISDLSSLKYQKKVKNDDLSIKTALKTT